MKEQFRAVVQGMACLGSFGRDIGELARRVSLGLELETDSRGRAAQADLSGLAAYHPARATRQMDHFTRMSLLAAAAALADAEKKTGAAVNPAATGIVLASGHGPASPTFQFLDSILVHGELMASPLSFSHSVHNIPAASIAIRYGFQGPCATFCQFESSVCAALLTALVWLEEGRAERILFGAADELTTLMSAAAESLERKLSGRGEERGRHGRSAPLSEGAAFFCLARDAGQPGYGRVTAGLSRRDFAPLARMLPEPRLRQGSVQGRRALYLSGELPAAKAMPAAHEDFEIVRAGRCYGRIPVAQAFDLALALFAGRPAACLAFDRAGLAGRLLVEPCATELSNLGGL